LPQVGGKCFADVRRERKEVVITPLSTHCEHPGPPIDIVEFQGDHFACAEPQAGQKQYHCTIAATDRRAAVAGLDDPFDIIRLKVPRNIHQPPSGHRWNGSCEVNLRLSASEEKATERADRRHHQLGSSGTARTGVPEYEAGDIVRDELSKTDLASSKTFFDELLEVAPVSGDCFRRNTTFPEEILFITFPQR
jgi:hypothetical protein